MKQLIKQKLRFLLPVIVLPEYLCEWFRYLRYSGVVFRKGKVRLRTRMMAQYHILEKGLTMPEPRPGFGQPQARELISLCTGFANEFGKEDSQLKHAVGVLDEYMRFQEEQGSALPAELTAQIERVCELIEPSLGEQILASSSNYFESVFKPFPDFCRSRFSVRNYGPGEVEDEKVRRAVKTALKSPSSCNRQGTKVHLEKRPEMIRQILEIQAGNRGFGHLAKAVIVVTGDIGACFNVYENHLPYVDGGLFAMSLMYALHHERLAVCPLNCYLSKEKLKKISMLCGFPAGEVPVVMMSLGHPPEEFKIAVSPRVNVDEVLRIAKD